MDAYGCTCKGSYIRYDITYNIHTHNPCTKSQRYLGAITQEGIVWSMKRNEYIGGRVLAARSF